MKTIPFILLVFPFYLMSCTGNKDHLIITYHLNRSDFIEKLTVTGTTQAVVNYPVMPPIGFWGQTAVLRLAEDGQFVNKGDIVFRLDPSPIPKFIIERNESLENEIASTNKLKAQIINNLQDLKSQLRNEQAAYEIKKLSMGKSGFESFAIRKVAELEFRQAEIEVNKIR